MVDTQTPVGWILGGYKSLRSCVQCGKPLMHPSVLIFSFLSLFLLLPTLTVSIHPAPDVSLPELKRLLTNAVSFNESTVLEFLKGLSAEEYKKELANAKIMVMKFYEENMKNYSMFNTTAFAEWFQQLPPKQQMMVIVAIAVGVGVALPITLVALVQAFGWGSGGVVAGTIAANIQAAIGVIASGGVFATLQSIGAVGVSWGTAVWTGLAAGVGACVASSTSAKQDTEEKTEKKN